MATLRAFKDNKRIATARRLKDDKIFQVYPNKQLYSSEKAWLANVKDVDEVKVEEAKKRKNKVVNALERWRERQMTEFLDASYSSMFQTVARVSPSRIRVVFHDGRWWEIERCFDYFKPPQIWKNGERLVLGCEEQDYSPAISCARWLLMLAFVTPE